MDLTTATVSRSLSATSVITRPVAPPRRRPGSGTTHHSARSPAVDPPAADQDCRPDGRDAKRDSDFHRHAHPGAAGHGPLFAAVAAPAPAPAAPAPRITITFAPPNAVGPRCKSPLCLRRSSQARRPGSASTPTQKSAAGQTKNGSPWATATTCSRAADSHLQRLAPADPYPVIR